MTLSQRITQLGPHGVLRWLKKSHSIRQQLLCQKIFRKMVKKPEKYPLCFWAEAFERCLGLDTDDIRFSPFFSLCANAFCACIESSQVKDEPLLQKYLTKYWAYPPIERAIKYTIKQHQEIPIGL